MRFHLTLSPQLPIEVNADVHIIYCHCPILLLCTYEYNVFSDLFCTNAGKSTTMKNYLTERNEILGVSVHPKLYFEVPGYELGQPKSGSRLKSNLVNHRKLGVETWKHWPWQNSAYMQVQTVRESDSISRRYPRNLQNNIFLPSFFANTLALSSYGRSKNSRSRPRWKLVYTMPKT